MTENSNENASRHVVKKEIMGEWALARLNTSQKGDFLKQWKGFFGLVHTKCPAQGFGDLRIEHPEDQLALWERGVVRLEHATSEEECFHAFSSSQVLLKPSLIGCQVGLESDIFFIRSSDQEARFGIRSVAWILGDSHSIESSCAEIEAMQAIEDHDRTWLNWLIESCAEPTMEDKPRVPSFSDLSMLLLTHGNICADFSSMRATIFEQEQLLQQLQQEIVDLNDENRRVRHQVGSVTHALSGAKSNQFSSLLDEEPEVSEGNDLGWLPDWARANEAQGRIAVLARALGSAKKSRYKNVGHIRSALEFLAGPYRQSRKGEIDQEALNKALEETGSSIRGSAGLSVAGAEGDSYYVMWNGRRRFMDMHITRGGGRDQRYCMRIYFFWDAESEMVVVGHLPSHLNNSLA